MKKTPRESQPELPAVPFYVYVIKYFPFDGKSPMYLQAWWLPRTDWVFALVDAYGFSTKREAERVGFDIAAADLNKLGNLMVEHHPSAAVGTRKEKLSGLSH